MPIGSGVFWEILYFRIIPNAGLAELVPPDFKLTIQELGLKG
jgi:hypothetical protein